jgi:hypothetical protein
MLSETSRSAGSVAQTHALHSIVKRRRLQAEEVDRCCDLQDMLIDVSLHQLPRIACRSRCTALTNDWTPAMQAIAIAQGATEASD